MKNLSTNPSPTPATTPSPLSIYTDGACSGNPGPGGCAGVLLLPDDVYEFSFHEPHTTNNRMEIRAVVEALNLAPVTDAVVHTDSMYVINAATKWIASWRRKGWRKGDGTAVQNRDLWEALLAAVKRHRSVTWRHVRGHRGDHYNERADQLATRAARGGEVRFSPAGRNGTAGRSSMFTSVRF